MPVKVAEKLPAISALENENVFVMTESRAVAQDIRPLKLAILNLMPTKEVTEIQLLRLIANTPLQVEAVLLRTASYTGKNTSEEHLTNFYKTFAQVKNQKFDALIVTGAPVEKMDFFDVKYWDELTGIFKWADANVFSTMYICWAAQAGLYYHHGVDKRLMDAKISGVFSHRTLQPHHPILRGFDDVFPAPHSRHTEVTKTAVSSCPDVLLLAESDEAGVYLAASKNMRHVYVTGHPEYDADTLHKEYTRDIAKGMKIAPPKHYYVNDKIGALPPMTWRSHSMLLFNNWLNYCVYQQTPYNFLKRGK